MESLCIKKVSLLSRVERYEFQQTRQELLEYWKFWTNCTINEVFWYQRVARVVRNKGEINMGLIK